MRRRPLILPLAAPMTCRSSSSLVAPSTAAGAECVVAGVREGWGVGGRQTNHGKVMTEKYCSLTWIGIDQGYNEIKLCTAKAIAKPMNMAMLEYRTSISYDTCDSKTMHWGMQF